MSHVLLGYSVFIKYNRPILGLPVNSSIYFLLSYISFYIVPSIGFIYILKKSKDSNLNFKLRILKEINIKELFIDIVGMYIFITSYFFMFYNCNKETSEINSIFFIINSLFSIIIAPIIEEFMYRGVLLHRLNLKFGIIKSITIVSILFGVVHISELCSIIFSCVLCVIYIRTKSIIVPIVYHASYNLIVMLLDLITLNINDKTAFNVGICGMIISIIWLIYFIKRERSYYLR